jgi:hypothetical protein
MLDVAAINLFVQKMQGVPCIVGSATPHRIRRHVLVNLGCIFRQVCPTTKETISTRETRIEACEEDVEEQLRARAMQQESLAMFKWNAGAQRRRTSK